ncbi:hypothetical protein HZH66_014293 [Vespula vulgaris]|uniref:Uncharacterized protein n=1 Tax=Vespula vulgaris TaxID=7454 RepID=A0A834J3N9_VESVU|nr:hypothetical protein HZH66_014293 [Vespula vulgaris]
MPKETSREMNPAFIHGGLAIGSETSKHGGSCEETEEMLSKGILGTGDFEQGKVGRNLLRFSPQLSERQLQRRRIIL